ncbi:GNAT family N-acetyltransferase [Culicoidibacter larvae]|uniref:GNAT family N-acetyltransferase n=1 Tax=Culicoidibacter larvae TaxID=2579976 RepID=A0A5R8QDH1_9FIRM|nr:GNAT family N-acetyltransferase [Culicoidibacter larvae]TLG74316.1 GNAT family N-acetyltransferase [Culicoidibacter larvae]
MNLSFTILECSDKQEFVDSVCIAGLLDYNLKQTNNKLQIPAPEIIKVARNQEGTIIGGISGSMFLSGIEIETLWVDERYRGHRIASTLLSTIEDEARKAGCQVAYLTTYSFQGPDFYPKCGYVFCGKVDGFIDDISLYTFKKELIA